MGCARRVCVAAIMLWVAATPFCAGRAEGVAKQYSAEELIAEIIASERRIHDVELHFDVILVSRENKVHRSLDWGYQGGKKYIVGKYFALAVPEMNIPAWEGAKWKAFDGEKFCSMSDKMHFSNGQATRDGLVGGVGPDRNIFPGLYPTRLLGYELVKKRPVNRTSVTLGECLRSARRVSLRPKVERVEGHPCVVVEAIGAKHVNVVGTASGNRYEDSTLDVRVWIDTVRGFRPLRIETYYGDRGPLTTRWRLGRWQVPAGVIQDIKLEKINDVWFPVDGTLTFFKPPLIRSADLLTEAQFLRLPRKSRQKLLNSRHKYVFKPWPEMSRRVRVYRDTVRTNKGIDPKKFTIEFPKGCEVWDEFRLKNYTIGEEGDPALDPHSSDSGVLHRLADYKVGLDPEQVKGKRILICFWRMGDAKSAQTLRRLRERANDLADTGVVPALVHAEPAKLEKIKAWLRRNQIPFSSGAVAYKYETGLWKVQSLPSFALTDAEHLLIARGFALDELNRKLRESNHAER